MIVLILTFIVSVSLTFTYTTSGSVCQLTTKQNFPLNNGAMIVDLEKFIILFMNTYQVENLDAIKIYQLQMELGNKVLKVRSIFSNWYLRSEYYQNWSNDSEKLRLANQIPYLGGVYNVKISSIKDGKKVRPKMSMRISFSLESQRESLKEGELTSFEIANDMAKRANSYKNKKGLQAARTVNTIIFNSNGNNATLDEVLGVMKSTKDRFILDGYPKLGLITPVAEEGSQSICKNASDVEKQEIFEIVKYFHQIFIGPITCSGKSSAEECVSHVISAVEDCSNRIKILTRGVNHAELLPLGIVTSTTSFGKDYLARGKCWCLLSEYAEETGRQVVMLDDDGFIRDYVEDSLNWDEPYSNANSGDEITTTISVSGAIAVVVILGLILILRYSRNYKNKSRLLTKGEAEEFFDGKSTTKCCWVGSAYNRDLEIDKDDIIIDTENILGSGASGCVYGGFVVFNERRQEVAVKTMITHLESVTTLIGLCSEIKVLSHLGTHEHIVSLVGAYTAELQKGLIYVVLEICPKGSLEKYLRLLRSPESDDYEVVVESDSSVDETSGGLNLAGKNEQPELIRFCREICSGVEYMASKKIVHGDLATRNVLLTSHLHAKISDFGLSRRLYEYSIYVKKQAEPLPWRWMAPETLTRLQFSEKSDVWSFGVTLWEIFAFGNTPYPGLGWRLDFPKELEKGLRLTKPEDCPQQFYDTMLTCWQISPIGRPTFSQLKENLGVDL